MSPVCFVTEVLSTLTAAAPGAHLARHPEPPATSSAPAARLRSLALSPLRKSHARRPALYRCSVISGSLRFLMTNCTNPLSRLAPRTSPHQCVPSMKQDSKTTFTGIPERLHRRSLMQLLTTSHHHRQRSSTTESSAQPWNSIQYP